MNDGMFSGNRFALGVVTLSFGESTTGVHLTSSDGVEEVGSNIVKIDHGLQSVQNGLSNCICIVAFVDQGESLGPTNC